MKRPDSVAGLSLVLLRQRARPRHLLGLAAVGAALALTRAATRAPASTRAAQAHEGGFFARPSAREAVAVDAELAATPTGWMVAWADWSDARTPKVLARALAPDGAPRGVAVTLSTGSSFARLPRLARCGDAVGVGFPARGEDPPSQPLPHFAALRDDGSIRVAARAVGREPSYQVSVACDRDGWALGRHSDSGPYLVERLGPDGATRGAFAVPSRGAPTVDAALTRASRGWLLGEVMYDRSRDRSRVAIRWLGEGGAVRRGAGTDWREGQSADLRWTTRGDEAWATWADDRGFAIRHDPMLLRVRGDALAQGPTRLGPRRSATHPNLSCDLAGCVGAWVEPRGASLPRLFVQALHHDGSPRGEARTLGPTALLGWQARVALARSLDERVVLAAWSVELGDPGDGVGLMGVRLDVDATPQGEAFWIAR